MITPKWNPAVIAAVVTGVATAIAAVGAGIITSRSSEEQLEANLITEAVKVCDKWQATNNLKFLMAVGFLPNHAERLNKAFDEGLEKVISATTCPPNSK
jgi:uncharacterized protein YejL (UPF0352 family)